MIFNPNELFFKNTNLLGENPRRLRRLFKKWDSDLIDEGGEGFTSKKYGLGVVFCEGIVDAVVIGDEEYFNHEEEEVIMPAITTFHLTPSTGLDELKVGLTSEEYKSIFKIKPLPCPELLLEDDEKTGKVPVPENYVVCFIYYDAFYKSFASPKYSIGIIPLYKGANCVIIAKEGYYNK
ncbi:MAG: hypothetical protein Q4F05_06810 [bacterium]|nr:hypothetical protein [bacterium]